MKFQAPGDDLTRELVTCARRSFFCFPENLFHRENYALEGRTSRLLRDHVIADGIPQVNAIGCGRARAVRENAIHVTEQRGVLVA